MEGSNPIWMKAYANECFRNDDGNGSTGNDSLDDNVLESEEDVKSISSSIYKSSTNDIYFGNLTLSKLNLHTHNNLNKHMNIYQQIKPINGTILHEKFETTEL
jgi:hypothetical protein